MLNEDVPQVTADAPTSQVTPVRRSRRRAASRPAGPPVAAGSPPSTVSPASTSVTTSASDQQPGEEPSPTTQQAKAPRKAPARRTSKKSAAAAPAAELSASQVAEPAIPPAADPVSPQAPEAEESSGVTAPSAMAPASPMALLFQPPQPLPGDVPADGRQDSKSAEASDETQTDATEPTVAPGNADGQSPDETASNRRRRSRGGRSRRKPSGDVDAAKPAPVADESGVSAAADKSATAGDAATAKDSSANRAVAAAAAAAQTSGDDDGKAVKEEDDQPIDTDDSASSSSRRRRRRRRDGEDTADAADDPTTVVKVREPRAKKDAITSVDGSTRVEAKKQRRREGRDAGRRRPPILSESEFLARREAVDRVMAIRQRGGTTQIAVLEDGMLVEHYVAVESQDSLIGNVYLGRVQNVLPSMEAAFIDIGKGRNAVLYAGEVDWSLRGDSNQPRRIENALKAGQAVLVQVTKDPVGHKGARLTSQISLPGRYLVYVPGGGTSGISRKLPDTERNRLKNVLKDLVPEDAGVIIRTAAEGTSEDELTRDVARLTARWDDIEKKAKNGQAPQLLYGEPDTTIKVVRDLFTEDFGKLVISGDDAWDMVEAYVRHVAPDLEERLQRYSGDGADSVSDLFADYRIDEQIAKALERKVWLPSGGSLVIDRTEAMTVVDVNTGKFTGAGGNLEQTVTKNNLEAAEEIVRQLRLRDIGGIIVIDFIDMVLEDNRDLVLRRLVECLGRDRTRHQVAEVTSLGLVQMTRKRISTGLLEAFSENCEHCNGRGVVIKAEPVVEDRSSSNGSGGSGRNDSAARTSGSADSKAQSSSTPKSKASSAPKPKSSKAKRSSGGSKAAGTDPLEQSPAEQPQPQPQPVTPESTALTPVGANP